MLIESKDKILIEISPKYQGKTHPYGPLGGNMNNNVVIALQKYFLSQGYITVCLNFRGCGHSQGKTSWTGMPEREDYISVINLILDATHLDYKNLNFPKVNRLILCVNNSKVSNS
ncbi:hypothetical protein RO3G_04822 [Rhizopus delemar RA 99-880]|uniref:Xaa-Pro dipeptidyl-peptidase-like domain-containing protein n=1 Tax=Rhizopus delemar (strain RA 99-880 / ATCC MYA-4621 / FGSC 9543 / NRRL 43880) TaxID=246409 RepID=I1BV87_RHIO9|nr:hypothetical protein RO3G_04822 [Rhizopus delemar RA 99-880]|eukprot:EIE80117.1 hypothetical protein RO3G_04822 [Rhizopus delemar RA 99-880]